MVSYRKATSEDLELLWNMNIDENPEDDRWISWKNEYIYYNNEGKAETFAVICGGSPVGEGTLLFSPECKAVSGRTSLADGKTVANVNALRILKEYEGQGYISAMMRILERRAIELGYTRLTIGVDACETRNLAIYLHWGYNEFVMSETEDGELVLYYAKDLRNT